jgi:hypothetical protein
MSIDCQSNRYRKCSRRLRCMLRAVRSALEGRKENLPRPGQILTHRSTATAELVSGPRMIQPLPLVQPRPTVADTADPCGPAGRPAVRLS